MSYEYFLLLQQTTIIGKLRLPCFNIIPPGSIRIIKRIPQSALVYTIIRIQQFRRIKLDQLFFPPFTFSSGIPEKFCPGSYTQSPSVVCRTRTAGVRFLTFNGAAR